MSVEDIAEYSVLVHYWVCSMLIDDALHDNKKIKLVPVMLLRSEGYSISELAHKYKCFPSQICRTTTKALSLWKEIGGDDTNFPIKLTFRHASKTKHRIPRKRIDGSSSF